METLTWYKSMRDYYEELFYRNKALGRRIDSDQMNEALIAIEQQNLDTYLKYHMIYSANKVIHNRYKHLT